MKPLETRIKQIEDSAREREIQRLLTEEDKLFGKLRSNDDDPEKGGTLLKAIEFASKRFNLMRQSPNVKDDEEFKELQGKALTKILSFLPEEAKETLRQEALKKLAMVQ